MSASVRPYATAGMAIATAGVTVAAASIIAVAPTAPPALRIAPSSASPAFELAAFVDNPISTLVEVGATTQTNGVATALMWADDPFPWLQQVIVNGITYLGELPDTGKILDQIATNIDATINVATAKNEDTLDVIHKLFFGILEAEVPADLKPILDFTTTDNSGIIMGLVGVAVGPFIAAFDQLAAFAESITTNPGEAVNALLNIPAAMFNAFFNGGVELNLDGLIPALDPILPSGVTITKLDLALGGLFSPAGSLFNTLGVTADIEGGGELTVPGVGAGLLSSLFANAQSIAKAIGRDGGEEEAEAEAPAAALVAEAPAEFDSDSDESDDAVELSDTHDGTADESDDVAELSDTDGDVGDEAADESEDVAELADIDDAADESDDVAELADDADSDLADEVADESDDVAELSDDADSDGADETADDGSDDGADAADADSGDTASDAGSDSDADSVA